MSNSPTLVVREMIIISLQIWNVKLIVPIPVHSLNVCKAKHIEIHMVPSTLVPKLGDVLPIMNVFMMGICGGAVLVSRIHVL